MKQNHILAIITGPTASGKTSLAIRLATYYGSDIISADSRQIYHDIPIGTAAPTATELQAVRHHFVGTLKLSDYYSAAKFEEDVLKLLPNMWDKSNVAIMCGGSMMYVDAICKGIDEMPTVSGSTRSYVAAMLNDIGLHGLLAQLQILDPAYYEQVDHANTRRVAHAVEICLESGKTYSELRKGIKAKRPFEIVKMMIDMPRAELFERINKRVKEMFELGLEEEARQALSQGDYNSLNTVGYKELKDYFCGKTDLNTAKERIARNTRVYAKKQLTWLARDAEIIRLKPDDAFERAISIIDDINT